jgi:hypothetical protein
MISLIFTEGLRHKKMFGNRLEATIVGLDPVFTEGLRRRDSRGEAERRLGGGGAGERPNRVESVQVQPSLTEPPTPGSQPGRPAAYLLPRIPYTRLRVTLRALEAASLPGFKGSLLRGAFGHALRRAVCAMGPAQPCLSCRLRQVCVYTRLFETFIEGEAPPFLRGLNTSPRPYVFEPEGEARELSVGAPLAFDLLLVGQAIELQPYALLAVERMAELGLGQRRFRFRLDSVEAERADGTWQPVLPGSPPGQGSPLCRLTPADAPIGRGAVLRFITPTRLRSRNRLMAEVSFRELVFAMLRRALELAYFHVPEAAVDWSFRPLLEAASKVEVTAGDLRWHDWERYSNRQQTRMSMGGFIGSLELAGDLSPFSPLLRTAETLHVGKGATFGLGKFMLSPGSGPSRPNFS